MTLQMKPRDATVLRRPVERHPNARQAFRSFLQEATLAPGERVLLPAYVGWSPREGSGVLDPVQSLGLDWGFYRLDSRLRLDLEHLEVLLSRRRVKVLVLIHYFGEVDPAYPDAVALARRFGARVLEDEAHAMLSDLVGGICGRAGDACICSLHKILPVDTGGLLIWNDPARSTDPGASVLAEYDLSGVARARRDNARALTRLLEPLGDRLDLLWDRVAEGVVPQTLPVVLRRANRDRVYHEMNAAGFGVTSLYHTLVREMTREDFPEAHALSRRILNLPVHQEIRPGQLPEMVDRLERCLAIEDGIPA